MSPAEMPCGFPGRRARSFSGSETSSVVVGEDAQAFLQATTSSGLLNESW
jgi:hypothetical protein